MRRQVKQKRRKKNIQKYYNILWIVAARVKRWVEGRVGVPEALYQQLHMAANLRSSDFALGISFDAIVLFSSFITPWGERERADL